MSELPHRSPVKRAAPSFTRSDSFTNRPDYAAIAVSTSPVVSPPPSPLPDAAADERLAAPAYPPFSRNNGPSPSLGSYSDDKDPLLPRRRSSTQAVFGRLSEATPSNAATLGKVAAYLITAVALVYFIIQLLSPRSSFTSLTPFLPAALTTFMGSTGISSKAPHPILPLLSKADTKWSSMLSSQSTTVDRATRTYKARYALPPPPGFDKWFAFATQGRNHSLVDEYDQLMTDLLPFRSLRPAEIRRRTAELAQVPGISIVSIRNGVAQVHSKSGKWAPALAFQQMLASFVKDLPDMDVALNEKPEGRVLPRKQRNIVSEDYGVSGMVIPKNMSDPMVRPTLKGFQAEWGEDGSVWDAVRRSCPVESPARRLTETVRSAEIDGSPVQYSRSTLKTSGTATRRKQTGTIYPSARDMTFNADVDSSFDVCRRPSLHSLHSTFFSDQRSIEYLYPVFSPSKPEGYADILIPSHHYWSPSSEFTYEWEMKRGRTKEPTDIAWEHKRNSIYWRGKVAKGADTPPGRSNSFQKQRLVKMANEATPHARRVLVHFDPVTAGVSSASVLLAAANKAVCDVAMACDPSLGECAYLKSLGYRVEAPGPLGDAWKHKYVLDLDEIGFSPKFLALMESKSALIKSTVQKEFWSGWIVPWKHYIPLSSAYSELHNIAAFFTGIPEVLQAAPDFNPLILTTPSPVPSLPTTSDGKPFTGDRALRDIAEAGREWRQSHARKEDMECYVYRLMIEWAAMLQIED